MSYLMPTLSGDGSRILLFLKAVRYGRHEEILTEFFLTVKNLSFAPGGPRCCPHNPLVQDLRNGHLGARCDGHAGVLGPGEPLYQLR